eukprot:g8158.t1
MSASSRRHPDMQHPPDGYSLIEPDLHRATTSLEVESFPFLSQLKLRSAINLSAEAIHDQAIQFFLDSGIAMLNPRALESFEGPYDLWEEAAKESLELLLDADNHPMILLDSPTECESACLVGCLRRLQHWSMVAIHDEYHMMTMRETWYSTSQQFIERFDLDLVSLTANVPPWYRNHLTMLEEEREAEAELSRRDPDRATRLWVHGHGAFSAALSSTPSEVQQEKEDENQQDEDKDKGKDKEGETSPEDLAGNSSPSPSTHTLARQGSDVNQVTRDGRRKLSPQNNSKMSATDPPLEIEIERERRSSSDMGELLHSPSAALMTLVDCDHLNDFDAVCNYVSTHAMEVVREVHGVGTARHQGRLTIDNHRVLLNCPPAPEDGDSHGHILIKTISERSSELGISMKREFRVCDEQDTIHVREDMSQGGDNMSHKEAHIPKKFTSASK